VEYKQEISWLEPLEFAQKISQNYGCDWVFLYSGIASYDKELNSYIALFASKNHKLNSFQELESLRKKALSPLFGYISYEALRDINDAKTTKSNSINFSNIQFLEFDVIIKFLHQQKKIIISYQQKEQLLEIEKYLASSKYPKISYFRTSSIKSNFSDLSYQQAIKNIKYQIANGDFYQVNLTRKFFGELKKDYKSCEVFTNFVKLCQISPANYSSFLKIDNKYILSSSPELFISIKDNIMISKPIKGTSPRSSDLQQDQNNKNNLKNSAKERAENLMIVDLVRNDLSQICQPKSVKVDSLFDIDSYKTIHHMSSQISGRLNNDISIIDAVKASFPAGSMTGAPKIAAMKNIAKNEKIDRGIYSGAIGFINKDEVNLSVVIRTLIIENNKYEFQVGGAITYDSNPKKELEEIYSKACALKEILGLNKVSQNLNLSS